MDFLFDSFCLQLQLLLQYLRDDPRKAVKRLATNDLKLLAKKAPHLWLRENTQVDLQILTLSCCLDGGLISRINLLCLISADPL